MKTILFLTALFCLIGCSSVGPAGPTGKDGSVGPAGKDGTQDKQIIYILDNSLYAHPVIEGNPVMFLLKFDIRNYVGVDSIVLYAIPYVTDWALNDPDTTYAVLEMFDMTNHVSIAHSTITTNRRNSSLSSFTQVQDMYLQSGNFYKYLPKEEITLGVRLHSTSKTITVGNYLSYYLILYRK